jgi:hypothetical protein
MAVAILKFNLDDPQDRMAHMRCVKSQNMANFLFQISNNLRENCELACDELAIVDDKYDVIDVVMREVVSLIEENDINLHELI